MTVEQIRHTCITASEVYYNYLADNNRGVYNINIRKIEKVGKDRFKLNINGKIFDEETLVFKHLATNNEYNVESVKIQVYDRDTNTVVIKPKPEIYSKFDNANVNDWVIISDMKFLVERVRRWYESNGRDIALPENSSILNPPNDSIFFENEVPSIEQKEALTLIFTKPLTYIWGAPGTGKTQFVLSYAILHYLANKKKVAIVAPTNHALEQIYRGVIKMTDKAGINRDKILRLGGPSKKFADEFPEVCEIIGLENQLKQINAQVAIIEKILGIDSYSEKIENINLLKSYFQEITNYYQDASDCIDKEKALIKEKDDRTSEYRSLELKLEYNKDEQIRIKKKKASITYKIISMVSKVDFEAEIDALIEKQSQLERDILRKAEQQIEIEKRQSENNESKQKALKLLKITIQKANKLSEALDIGLPEITLESDFDNLNERLETELQTIESEQPVYKSLSDEYSKMDKLTLEAKYQKFKADQERLANYSTEQRLKNVSIIGATLDTYLYRFKEDKLGVDHIFLDEAGYSNIIKAMTVFNQKVPVTFLGDHMQLPPVCEISKQDIQRNENYRPVMVWDQSAIFLEDLFNHEDLNTIVHRYINNIPADFNLLVKSNLTGTFRFGKSLADVLQRHVYPEGFSSNLDEETNIIVYKVQNHTSHTNGTRYNRAEVEAITSFVRSSFNEESSVAILAPYSAQVRALTNALPEYQKQNKVLTVHKSQGQEWDTVIYSVCDIGNGKRPWFTDSENTMSSGLNNINTAISRAKKTLIIVCNPDEWRYLPNQLITGIINSATKTISA